MSIVELAYAVPFVVRHRDGDAHVTVVNVGADDVPWLRIDLVGPGLMAPLAPGRMIAGEVVELRVAGADLARGTKLQLTWMRIDGAGPFVWQSGL